MPLSVTVPWWRTSGAVAVAAVLALAASPAGAAPAPAPAAVSGLRGELNYVSCPTASFCMALGWDGVTTVVATYRDGSWALSHTNIGDPAGFSCASPHDCIAIGHRRVGAYLYNGTTWQVAMSLSNSQFSAVGCGSPDECTLVTPGALYVLSGAVPNVVLISGAGRAQQYFACTSSPYCVGVNATFDTPGPGAEAPTAAVYNNGNWSKSPIPPAGFNTQPYAVACTEPNSCVMVGEIFDDLLPDGVAVEQISKGTWGQPAVNDAPQTSAEDETLFSVGCAAITGVCTAEGNDDGFGSNVPVYNFVDVGSPSLASPWAFVQLPAAVGQPSASCPTTTFCVVAGARTVSGTPRTVLETWDGRAWAVR